MHFKNYYLFVLIFCSLPLFSQVIKGRITDSLTKLPVAYANIAMLNKNKGTSADANGNFEFLLEQSKDSLVFSCVGYTSKQLAISSFTDLTSVNICLQQHFNELKEIFINPVKIKYSGIKKFGLPKKAKIITGLPFGTEICGLIKNTSYRNGIVKSVVLDLQKNKNADYISSYNIKFYEYDKLLSLPGKELYDKHIIVYPENKTYTLKIAVDTLNIPLPANGICVGIQIINTKYTGKLKEMAQMGPYMNFTHTPLEILSWSRYRNKDWHKQTHKSQVRKDFVNFMIGIEATTEK